MYIVARKSRGRLSKTWDDRKKFGMDSADPRNRSEWRERLRGTLVRQAQPSVEENLKHGYDDEDDDCYGY